MLVRQVPTLRTIFSVSQITSSYQLAGIQRRFGHQLQCAFTSGPPATKPSAAVPPRESRHSFWITTRVIATMQLHPSAASAAVARTSKTWAPPCYRPLQSRRLATPLTTTFAAASEVQTHSSSTSIASHDKPTHGTTPNAQGAAATQAAGTPLQDAVVLVGFHPEEIQIIRQQLQQQLEQQPTRRKQSRKGQPASEQQQQAAASRPSLPVVAAGRSVLTHTVEQLLTHVAQQQQQQQHEQQQQHVQAQGDEEGGSVEGAEAADTAVEHGRVVLLVGEGAQQRLGAPLNDWLAEWGVVPALIAAYQQPRHCGLPLHDLVAQLREAHVRYYSLLQPVRVEGVEEEAVEQDQGEQGQGQGPGRRRALRVSDAHAEVLSDARVVLSAALDAGEVPSIHGHYRPDAGHLVVLDGLLAEGERAQLLDWVTAPGHDHAGPPPGDKWEMACVDRMGDRATWGLQPHVLAALRDDPPPPAVALQSRLAALYPEYDIAHMPAEQISDAPPEQDDDDGPPPAPLSSFVGNAVMAGDPCAWHVDADPTTVPPYSPWVHNYGYYHNREQHRPLFVTMLLYLNESWPEDWHSETMFLDPETQLGLFVRPAAGRVVLMEQDMPHRISAPSRDAPGPRYSLVWKLVFVPKDRPAGQQQQGQQQGHEPAAAPPYQSICRPEWGEPVRIGSANARAGTPAFQR